MQYETNITRAEQNRMVGVGAHLACAQSALQNGFKGAHEVRPYIQVNRYG